MRYLGGGGGYVSNSAHLAPLTVYGEDSWQLTTRIRPRYDSAGARVSEVSGSTPSPLPDYLKVRQRQRLCESLLNHISGVNYFLPKHDILVVTDYD